jgi:FkbM family methyltransferase
VLTRIEEQLPFKDRLHPLQYDYANFSHGLDITARLTQRGTFNSCPFHVIDAGAQGGFEARWNAYGNQIELIGFEADADECKRLNARRSVRGRKESFYPMALYRNKGTKTLYLTKNGVASSFLPTNLNFVSRFPHAEPGTVVGSVEVQTTDLDSFVKESGLSYVDFIKVDVEGAELAVLEGARRLLSESILGLSIEIFFQPYRVGQPTFAEIDGYLKQFNFSLFNLEPERWVRKTLASHEQNTWYRSGQMMWAQAIYFKDIVPELSMDTAAITGDTRMKALKLATLAEVFGFPDYSIEIVKYL